MSAPAEWFREWFGEPYLALYPHRDEEEAAAGVRLFREHADPGAGARVLDLACGAGRHLRHLVAAGYDAVGVDLSPTQLAEARARAGLAGRLARGDMRDLPFGDGRFLAVVNFFTSFGYFATPEEDARVVGEIARVLAPGGRFLIDYLNAARVRERLVRRNETETEGRRVVQTRWLDGEHVIKRIEIHPPGEGRPDTYFERVRLYEPDLLVALLAAHGLSLAERYGDYDGTPATRDAPRLLLVGRAA
ncbi:MAG: class I SAM-dependent methyltransferase [Gemmatimonadota bacterium]